ncbi:MAG: cytochrome c biogenesis protein CcsA [Verrucomicrobiota bacterium]
MKREKTRLIDRELALGMARWVLVPMVCLLVVGCGKKQAHVESYAPWSDEVVDTFASIPVLSEGRIKPLDTLAQFTMLSTHGKRTMRVNAGEGEAIETYKVGPTAWILDILFRPELARDMPSFVVNDDAVLVAMGLPANVKRRDRYSYNELVAGRARLSELATEYSKLDPDQQSRLQKMILNLAGNMSRFEYFNNQFEFVRNGVQVDAADLPEELFGDEEGVPSVQDMIGKLDALREYVAGDPERITPELGRAIQLLEFYAATVAGLNIFPPAGAEEEEWYSGGELIEMAVDDAGAREWAFERLTTLEDLVAAEGDEEAFATAATAFRDQIVTQAEARGEGTRAGMEVFFYKGRFFYWAMVLFTLGVVLAMLSWLSPASKMGGVLTKGVWGCGVIGLAMLVMGIVLRSVIQMRPPIHNLYDTILFITAVAVLVGLVLEAVNRRRMALAVAVILGALGMYLSLRYETFEAKDTIESVRAVLDSNFWLTTHVIAINIGYCGGLLAAGLAHVYLVCRIFGVAKQDRTLYRELTRMVYGVVCFALFFSLVGTVLGGVWANDSWGRFWGWDPKENGALMIVLWCLMILHAKMGGYIRELGINIWAVILGVIVSFSWWGVNQLGVGLHSYGFTDGVWGVLQIFWSIEAAVVVMGVVLWLQDRYGKPGKGGPVVEKPDGKRAEEAPAAG